MKQLYQILLGTALVAMTSCGSRSSLPEVTHLPYQTASSLNWGLIGVDGTVLCQDEIEGEPSVVVNGVVSVRTGSTTGLIDPDAIFFKESHNPSDFTKLGPDDRAVSYYTVGKTLEKINDIRYLDGGFCTEGLIPVVEKAQGISFIRKSGEVAFAFDECALDPTDEPKRVRAVNAYFSDGLCLYQNEDGHYGYINTKGEAVIGEYAYATPFNEGLAIAGGKFGRDSEHDNRFVVIDTKGKTVAELDVPFNLDDVDPAIYSDGLVFFGGKVFNRKGEIAFRLSDKIEMIYPFCNGYAIYEDEEMDYGLIDKNGEIVIQAGEYSNVYIAEDRVYFKDDGQTVCYDFKGDRIFKSENAIVPVGKNRCVLTSRKDCYFTDYEGEPIDKNSYKHIGHPVNICTPGLFLEYMGWNYVKWVESDYYDADTAVKSVLGALTKEGVGVICPGMPVTELTAYYNMGKSSEHAYDYWNNFEGVSGEGRLKTRYRVQFTEYIADYSEYNPDAKVGHIIIEIEPEYFFVTDLKARIRQAAISYLNQIGFMPAGHNEDWMDEAWDIYQSDTHDYLIALNEDGLKLCLEAN